MADTRGVYFQRDDYATFPRRLMVDLIDLAIFAILLLLSSIALAYLFVNDRGARIQDLVFLAGLAIAVLYFVVLKRSRFRTLGYRIGRVKVVDLNGRAPSYWSLVVRMLFGLLGPLTG